ncbi:hypothetical protein KGQ19_17610 [Catenulispora sp. NL8]|uniref:RNA polymerase, sigma-24 subunit, ECF subfamily n=1 Tax=Catenulispora pinistramenti TaxID=2705254 RepID=A0ABS5KRM8_9ACTN|nr:hypothetical protein [Catenulispora pinistramenti]MBS2548689.1 hypothetical protein [Catenulispora pinistramenti]
MSLLTSRAAPRATPSPEKEECRLVEVLQQVAAGDSNAFAAVYAILAPRVWAMAEAVTCGHELAEAAAVQAFEGVWRAAPSCPSDPEAATAWAMRIAVRRTVRATTAVRATTGPQPPAVKPLAASERQCRHVHQTLLALPERQRDAILLGCYARLPLRTLARTLELSKQDAAALLDEALIRVGKVLRISRVSSHVETPLASPRQGPTVAIGSQL